MRRNFLTICLITLSLMLGATQAGQANYTFTQIDVPGAALTSAFGINDAGQVVGDYEDASGRHGFLRNTDGSYITFDFPGAINQFGQYTTRPFGINNAGQIVGVYIDNELHGFLRDTNGSYTTIDHPNAYKRTEAWGINDAGQIVGSYNDSTWRYGILRDTDGSFTTIIVPDSYNNAAHDAYDINNYGQIVGFYYDTGSNNRAFLRDTYGNITTIIHPDAYNGRGAATGINDAGKIVGYYLDVNILQNLTFRRDTDGSFTTINVPGSVYSYGNDINNADQIVGYYYDGSFHHGFVATPCPSCNNPPVADAGINQTGHPGIEVTLDGSGSADPEGNVPLSYAWRFVSLPAGSSATLSDSATVNPSFTPDLLGEYVIQLTVTDSLGEVSAPDQVTVSTTNSAPVADAGPDQSVIFIGTTVQLDGSQSWDDDGDSIAYQWTFASLPSGSTTSLVDATSATPSFLADIYGDYIVQLVVNDNWSQSAVDEVTVSFENVAPVADAGLGGTIEVFNTFSLDGSGSSDANGDTLTYRWSIVSSPVGTSAIISDPTAMTTSFIPDLIGTYVVQLIVNDGILDSIPSTITVEAVYDLQTQSAEAVQCAIDAISSSDPSLFKSAKMQNMLLNRLNGVMAKIDAGNYSQAIGQIEHQVLSKSDGCAKSGVPENNDWIEDCRVQGIVYDCLTLAIARLEELL